MSERLRRLPCSDTPLATILVRKGAKFLDVLFEFRTTVEIKNGSGDVAMQLTTRDASGTPLMCGLIAKGTRPRPGRTQATSAVEFECLLADEKVTGQLFWCARVGPKIVMKVYNPEDADRPRYKRGFERPKITIGYPRDNWRHNSVGSEKVKEK